MIKDFVHSYRETLIPDAINLTLKSPRTAEIAFIGVETFNGDSFSLDLADGDLITQNSNVNPYLLNLDTGLTGSIDLYVMKNNIKSIYLDGGVFDFDLSEITLPRCKSVVIGGFITTNIVTIPNSCNSIFLKPDSEITGYSIRRNFFYTNMKKVVLNNQQGTGLTSGEVDDLLEDLSLATWIGEKKVSIIGINSARTSSSDAFVATLEGKGVTVLTN